MRCEAKLPWFYLMTTDIQPENSPLTASHASGRVPGKYQPVCIPLTK